MTDLALVYDGQGFDLALADGGLAIERGLATAVFISIFTDRRARADDILPDAGGSRGGWWGDAIPEVEGDLIGSRLWLLRRAKRTARTLSEAQSYVEECLAWMIEDGVAASVEVEVAALGTPPAALVLAIGATITRPVAEGGAIHRFDHVWDSLNAV